MKNLPLFRYPNIYSRMSGKSGVEQLGNVLLRYWRCITYGSWQCSAHFEVGGGFNFERRVCSERALPVSFLHKVSPLLRFRLPLGVSRFGSFAPSLWTHGSCNVLSSRECQAFGARAVLLGGSSTFVLSG